MRLLMYGVMALAILIALGGIAHSIYSAGEKAEQLRCQQRAEEVRKDEQEKSGSASTNLEKDNAKSRVVYKTITQKVDHYIDRPVYRNICLDLDGLRDANDSLRGPRPTAGESDKPVSRPDAAGRRNRGGGAEKAN